MRSSEYAVASSGERTWISRPVRVVLGQVGVDLLDQLGVVGAGLVEPEDRRGLRGAGPGDGQLHPVADRDVLGLAGAPDVAGLDVVGQQDLAGPVDDGDGAVGGDLERLVVRAVLLRRLRHQADVGDGSDRRRVERAVLLHVVDDGRVDPGVGGVGDDREGVVLGAVRAPQLAAVADQGRHGGVHDDVARHVQVGDPLVGVDVGQPRARGQRGLECGLDLRAVRQRLQPGQDRAEAVVGREAGGGEVVAVLVEDLREVRLHRVAEDDRVGDLHHGRLEVHREQHVLGLRRRQRVDQERPQIGGLHDGGVDDLARQHRERLDQHLPLAQRWSRGRS